MQGKVFNQGDLVKMCPTYSALERGQDHGDEITVIDIEDSHNFVHNYQEDVVVVLDQHPQESIAFVATLDKRNYACVDADHLTLVEGD